MAIKQSRLLHTLLENNSRMNAAQLASELGISVRTLYNYINDMNSQFPGIIASTPEGYHIDPTLARGALQQETTDIPQTPAERCNYVLNRLVQSGVGIPLYDLCDEMFISAPTFHTLLGRMRRLTRDYGLTLTVASDVITLTGSERNKRRLLSSLLYSESSIAFTSVEAVQMAFPSIDVEKVRDVVLEVLTDHHYFINDYSLINLVLHIAIALNRLQSGCASTEQPSGQTPLHSHEQELAEDMVKRLETEFNIDFSAAESYELALLLISRASALDYQAITPDNIATYIGEPCDALVHRLIHAVSELYAIDLSEPEFFVRFALHIRNLLVRASNKSLCKNPLVGEIRKTCPMIYDVSVQLSSIILEETGIAIDDDEIAYIALHLGGALETQKELAQRIQAVLYCPSYYNLDNSLSDRLSRRMGGKITLVNVLTSERELSHIDKRMLIISTVRPHQVLDAPLVVVSPFLTNSDVISVNRKIDEINSQHRRDLFREELSHIMSPDLFEYGTIPRTRDELLQHMCDRLTELGYTDPSFIHDVLERENMSSTSYAQFAVPHTLKMRSKRTGMYVYISRPPIQWDENQVNLVVLLCFNPEERKIFYDIFEPLSMLLLDANLLRGVLACRDYNTLIDYLVENLE